VSGRIVSASLYNSTGGTSQDVCTVTEHQSLSGDASGPSPLPLLQKAFEIPKIESGICEVVQTFASAGAPN
jgi:hypothetical protein